MFSSVLRRSGVLLLAQRAVYNIQVNNGLRTSMSSVSFKNEKEKLWNLGKLNHVAIAVPDLDKASKMYENVLGADVSDILLLHPLGDNSPIEGFLKKKADGGIHHICIEVDDIKAAMKDLKEHNIRSLNAEPKIGAHGKPVVFLHPKDCGGVLVEMEEA
ncbi:methylmalonyl-CoA epimerase, mitochondrial-like isoform X2 [Montipora capricornis]|uniref:methylmalonyl-CoA epimerase, mitochondrial-like isoform X2 n=1 Tax=Montipora capricornis TaxID=246305 RepID=UPI0035F14F8A